MRKFRKEHNLIILFVGIMVLLVTQNAYTESCSLRVPIDEEADNRLKSAFLKEYGEIDILSYQEAEDYLETVMRIPIFEWTQPKSKGEEYTNYLTPEQAKKLLNKNDYIVLEDGSIIGTIQFVKLKNDDVVAVVMGGGDILSRRDLIFKRLLPGFGALMFSGVSLPAQTSENKWQGLLQKIDEWEKMFKRGELSVLNFRPLLEKAMADITDDMLSEEIITNKVLYQRRIARLRILMLLDHWDMLYIDMRDREDMANIISSDAKFVLPWDRNAEITKEGIMLLNEDMFCRKIPFNWDSLLSFDHEAFHAIEHLLGFIYSHNSGRDVFLLQAHAFSECIYFEDKLKEMNKSLSDIIDEVDNSDYGPYFRSAMIEYVIDGIRSSRSFENKSPWDLYPATIGAIDFKKGKPSFREVIKSMRDYVYSKNERQIEEIGKTYSRGGNIVGQSFRIRNALMREGASFHAALYAQVLFLESITYDASIGPARATIAMKIFSDLYDSEFYAEISNQTKQYFDKKGLQGEEITKLIENAVRKVVKNDILACVSGHKDIDEKIMFKEAYSLAEDIKKEFTSIMSPKEISEIIIKKIIRPILQPNETYPSLKERFNTKRQIINGSS